MTVRKVLFAIALVHIVNANSAVAQCEVPAQEKLLAWERASSFGKALWSDGSSMAIGAPGGGTGVVYTFRNSGSWTPEEKLTPSTSTVDFGASLSVDQNVMAIGAPSDADGGSRAGAVYVFRFDGMQWNEEAKLLANDGQIEALFGSSVSVSGNVLAIGAPSASENDGAVYIHRYDGATWQFEQQLGPRTPPDEVLFGFSVKVEGDLLIAGAPVFEPCVIEAGSAYIFRNSGASWIEEARLEASDGAPDENDQFGWAVDIEGDRAVVTARGGDWSPIMGAAYVFDNIAGWTETQKLESSSGMLDAFGFAVDLSGDRILVTNIIDSGYLFELDPTGWKEKRTLRDPRVETGDRFGFSCALTPTSAIVGARDDDDAGNNDGAVYIFDAYFNELILSSSSPSVQAGDLLELTTKCGTPQTPSLLAVVEIVGAPSFFVLAIQDFDSSGEWTFGATVPPGLSGLSVTFQSFGASFSGVITDSNPTSVEFQ